MVTINHTDTKEDRINKYCESNKSRCKHFNGIRPINKVCKKGIDYNEIPRPIGCINIWDQERTKPPCYEAYTDQEAMQKAVEREEELEAHKRMMEPIFLFVIEWRKKEPIGKYEIVECPACKGKLHLSQASCNGHVHGECETEGCARWME